MSLFNELKRRNVFRVGIAYIVVAWLIAQVLQLVFENFETPGWVMKTVLVLLAAALPLVLFFAWAFEVTPEGIKREHDVDRTRSITPQTGKKLNNLTFAVLIMALGYFAYDKFVLNAARDAALVESTTQALTEQVDSTETRKSIAVLPFTNRSNREEDQFFTDGIHDDLLTTIAKIGSMKVISRTSVMEYKDTTKKIPQIAQELGVAHVLEGGIQRSGNQVRINVQLIDAQTDEHLWAEIYDRELTAENLFAIQSEISKAIAAALQATLSPEEEQRIDIRPTDNLLAYDAYMRGRQLIASRDAAQLKLAVEEFNTAVELDPGFALAWVGVADSNALLASYGTLSEKASLPIREEAIKRALAIDDNLGEAYASLGQIYNSKNQYEKAEAAYQKAIQLSPNYATAWQWYGNLLGNYPLRVDESIELVQKAAALDPRSSIIGINLGDAYETRGLYSMAERQYQKVIELDPGFAVGYWVLAFHYTYRTSRYEQALAPALKAQELAPENLGNLGTLVDIYLALGDLAAAENIRESMAELDANHPTVGFADVAINLYKNNVAGTRETINWLLPKLSDDLFDSMYMGVVELILGDKTRAREVYLSTVPGWLDPDQWPELLSRYNTHGCVVSWILMNTGDVDLGQQLLKETTVFLEESLPATVEHADLGFPEVCYLAAGDTGKALQSIETQLAHNHLYNWDVAHQLPMYDLVRFEPRYQAALQEREKRIAMQREAIKIGVRSSF